MELPLTLAEMTAIINGGGSVSWNYHVIAKLADLPTQGELDAYNALQEANSAPPVGVVADLRDVTLTSVTDGDVLEYDAGTSMWINKASDRAFTVIGHGVGPDVVVYPTTELRVPETGLTDLGGGVAGLSFLVPSMALGDLPDAAAARTSLGLGSLATQSGAFSGTSSGTNTGDQTVSDAALSTTDITTNNASSAKHGLLKKLSASATDYMDGTGAWSTPAGGMANPMTAPDDLIIGAGGYSVDLAYHKTVTVQSTYGGAASYVVDGDDATQWRTNYQGSSWVYIDLGSALVVGRVRFVFQNFWGYTPFVISYSNDATTWTVLLTHTPIAVDESYNLPSNITARYWKFANTAGDMAVYTIELREAYSPGAPLALAKGTDSQVLTVDPTTHHLVWATPSGGGGGAPTGAKYVVGASDGTLTDEIVIPSFVGHPDIVPASPTAYDDEFGAGSLDGKWTELNGGAGSTYDFSSTCINLVSSDRSPSRLWGFYETVPSGNWTFVAKVTSNGPVTSGAYTGFFLYLRNSSNSRLVCGGLNGYSTAATILYLARLTNPTTLSVDVAASTYWPSACPIWAKIAYNGTTIYWSFSRDGVQYDEQALSETQATFITSFDQIGFGVMPYGHRSRFSFDYIRRTA